MNWPTHTDYQDAIQNPEVCFAEADLKTGVPACDMLGLPRVTSGNFASVYELATSGPRWAIRCFVRQVSGQQGRYARLSQHLSGLQLDSIVHFEFILKGILVRGEWYPILKMQWVDGLPLNLYVERLLNEPAAIQKLAPEWRKLMFSLRENKLAHGDLQHGNVMVNVAGEFKLVDYDGMYAPVFGRGKSPELGHANFQHPRRTPDFYGERLDDFSALLIYISFLALAENPDLFQEFYTGDNILFLASDFKAPAQSKLLQKLKKSSGPELQQLTGLIEKCCLIPAESVPDFHEVMTALDAGNLETLLQKVSASSQSLVPDLSYLKSPMEPARSATRSSYDRVPVATPTQSHVFEKGGKGRKDGPPTPPSPSARTQTGGTEPAHSEGNAGFWKYAALALGALLIITMILIYLDRSMNREKPTTTGPSEESAETNLVTGEVNSTRTNR